MGEEGGTVGERTADTDCLLGMCTIAFKISLDIMNLKTDECIQNRRIPLTDKIRANNLIYLPIVQLTITAGMGQSCGHPAADETGGMKWNDQSIKVLQE